MPLGGDDIHIILGRIIDEIYRTPRGTGGPDLGRSPTIRRLGESVVVCVENDGVGV